MSMYNQKSKDISAGLADPDFVGRVANEMFMEMPKYFPNSYSSKNVPLQANDSQQEPVFNTALPEHNKEFISKAPSPSPSPARGEGTRTDSKDNSNIHRAAHALAARATDGYEGAREKIRQFINASSREEIIFVRGCTEGINLVAQTCGRKHVGEGDEIVVTALEHHANIVPWQMLAQEKGAVLRVAPINDKGEIILEEYEKLLGPKTRIVGLSQVSNVLGTVVPVREMTEMAHRHGAKVVIDGAQSIPHFKIDVQGMDCDFFAFSGHKLFGPTGIGVLYGKKSLLEDMPPWQGGGSMIKHVTFEKTTYNELPNKFEAGTPHIAGAIGLGAAIDYLNQIGHESAMRYEMMLMSYARNVLSEIPGLIHYGTAPGKVSVLSFNATGMRSDDMGSFLDKEGIALRAGHHCAQPTMARYGVSSMVRPSLAFYNTTEEIDALAKAIRKAMNR